MLKRMDPDNTEALRAFLEGRMADSDPAILAQTAAILDAVRREGDKALFAYTKQFDQVELNSLQVGQSVHDFVGPLGRATEVEGLKKVCVVGGGVGCAIALPIARELHEQGCVVHSVVGFRNKDLLILEDEFKACSDELRIMTDDGSYGTKGVVTAALDELVAAGNQYDLVITIGPLIMMKFVVKTCQKHGLKSIVSMNPIMIDGTGMCGGCRLTVGGETKFACVDGPDFDGQQVDWDLAVKRNQMYHDFEVRKHEEVCNLFKQEVK